MSSEPSLRPSADPELTGSTLFGCADVLRGRWRLLQACWRLGADLDADTDEAWLRCSVPFAIALLAALGQVGRATTAQGRVTYGVICLLEMSELGPVVRLSAGGTTPGREVIDVLARALPFVAFRVEPPRESAYLDLLFKPDGTTWPDYRDRIVAQAPPLTPEPSCTAQVTSQLLAGRTFAHVADPRAPWCVADRRTVLGFGNDITDLLARWPVISH